MRRRSYRNFGVVKYQSVERSDAGPSGGLREPAGPDGADCGGLLRQRLPHGHLDRVRRGGVSLPNPVTSVAVPIPSRTATESCSFIGVYATEVVRLASFLVTI